MCAGAQTNLNGRAAQGARQIDIEMNQIGRTVQGERQYDKVGEKRHFPGNNFFRIAHFPGD